MVLSGEEPKVLDQFSHCLRVSLVITMSIMERWTEWC